MHKMLYLRAFYACLWYNIMRMINVEEINKLQEKLEKMDREELMEYAIGETISKMTYLDQLASMKRSKFGSTSEKTSLEMLPLFNEIEKTFDNVNPVDLLEPEVKDTKKGKKRKPKAKENDYSDLEIKETIHHSLKDRSCPECGSLMKELKPTISYELKYKPAEWFLIKHVIHNYVCPECSKESDGIVCVEPKDKPVRLIEGSVVTSSAVAGLAYNKYVLGTPLYRQEQDLNKQNICINRQNMSNWMMQCSNDYLEYVFDQMCEDFKKLEIVHLDETPLQIIEDCKDGRKKGYVWMGMSGTFETNQMALYFSPGNRKYENATMILGEDNHAIAHSDGYEAYHKDICLMVVGCMAHVRRKFVEAQKASVGEKEIRKLSTREEKIEYLDSHPGYKNILIAIHYINKLFKIEETLKKEGATPTERYKRRQEESLPIFNEFFAYLHEIEGQYLPKGKMGSAISYTFHEEEYLRNFFKDGRCELSNNLAEQRIKPFVIARKNFLFSNTKNGAKASTIYFSLIESAKMNKLNPYKYLEYVLDTLSTKGLSNEIINSVLPYSKQLPKNLYVK